MVSARKPFGFDTTFKGHREQTDKYNLLLYQNGGIGYVSLASVQKNQNVVPYFKVFIPRASSGSDNFPHPVLSLPFLGEPNSVCTETYMYIGKFDQKVEAENLIKYIKCRLPRFLALLLKSTQDTPQFIYSLIPLQDFTLKSDIDWSQSVSNIDCQLYDKYGLTDDEIAFIESMIKPM